MIRALAMALTVMATAPLAAQEQAVSGTGALLRALDKVNGQTLDVRMASGTTAEVMGLQVELADCRYPADNPTGDAFAYLVIHDPQHAEPRFSGWMIASSPALSALDHSRYDVWVLRCTTS